MHRPCDSCSITITPSQQKPPDLDEVLLKKASIHDHPTPFAQESAEE